MSTSSSVVAHIARPYARALFDLATEEKNVPEVEKSLDELGVLIGQSEDFSDFLKSPVISADIKTAIIDKIVARAGFPEIVANFIRLVAKNDRLLVLPAIIPAFGELAAKQRGEVRAEITSATPLNKQQLSSLGAVLKKQIGKSVKLDTNIDPSLIGGLMVKVGSRMIDSSIKTKLTAMKIAMKEVS
ncbi:ATP synthase delta chain [hydrothermal vent metagenome]|uniref:ATP synthase delta chain n=1 Tax=hydrothermal vent metagenome TaxID=652676 RepID=A0A3B0UPV0_9ZZZZ